MPCGDTPNSWPSPTPRLLQPDPVTHVLALVTDAYGGRGGIARYNRDILSALSARLPIDAITVLPRLALDAVEGVPPKVTQRPAIFDAALYSANCLRVAALGRRPDIVYCGHILMAPLGVLLAKILRVPLWLQIHGVDAWDKPSRSVKWAAERAALVTTVSRHTKLKFQKWWRGDPARVRVLPNTVGCRFTPGPKPPHLLDRYGLHGRRIILTVSRLTYPDRYKGIERIIANLARVCEAVPDATYLISGDGNDAPRLKQLATEHGVADKVVFAGYVPEEELPEHFRLADVYAMPSTKEGFGIVFLEAAQSGLPVIGGNVDGSVDALADGRIGRMIDPLSADELTVALIDALQGRVPARPDAVERFNRSHFNAHVDDLVRSLIR